MDDKIHIRFNSEGDMDKLTSAYDKYESNYNGSIDTRRDGDGFVASLDRDKVGDYERLYQDIKLTGGDVDLNY
jgi:hypothetical protein